MSKKITISGDIGWEVKPSDITAKLDEAAGADLEVHIASPGGFVFDGIEIFNAFRDYKRKHPSAQMSATIKGLAASMASYLAVNPVFDLTAAEDNAVFMIHNASGGAVGDYRDMSKMAEILNGVTDLISQAYVKKTGKSDKAIRQLMDEETWYFGNEIKEAGFVDEIIPTDDGGEKSASLAAAKLKYQNLKDKLPKAKIDIQKAAAYLAPPNIHAHNPALGAGNNINQEVPPMTMEELKAQHPALCNQIFEDGKKAGKSEMKTAIDAASPYLNSETYPAPIKNLAVKVVKGEESASVLVAAVSAFDASSEAIKSAQAKGEQPGTTKGEQTTQLSDTMSQIKRDRVALGLEV